MISGADNRQKELEAVLDQADALLRPENGAVLFEPTADGNGRINIHNGTSSDAVVELTDETEAPSLCTFGVVKRHHSRPCRHRNIVCDL